MLAVPAVGEPRLVRLAAAAEAKYWQTARAAYSSSSAWYMAFTGEGWVALAKRRWMSITSRRFRSSLSAAAASSNESTEVEP